MPGRQLRGVSVFLSVVTLCLMNAASALANARGVPAAALVAPPYAPPLIDIESTPRHGTSGSRELPLGSSPLGLNAASKNAHPVLGVPACATEPFRATLSADASTVTAARQLERLRLTAVGRSPDTPQKPFTLRDQRLQANAAWQMGLLTLHGICIVPNTSAAKAWFELAQQLGEPLASAGLAWCEIEGCKGAANPAAARKWIEQLRSADAPRALYLQWLQQSKLAPLEAIEPGRGGLEKSYTPLQSRQLLLSAARFGDTNAKIELGFDSVMANELPQAVAFFKSAAARSTAATANYLLLSQRLKNIMKTQVPIVLSSAISIQPQSAADNLALAQRYHQGLGVPSNYAEAIRLYQLAQNQGNVTARKMLGLIFSRPAPDGQIDLAWMQQLAQVDLTGPTPRLSADGNRENLLRDPTPLFELVPQQWRKFATSPIRG